MSKNDENLNQLVIKFIKSLYSDNDFIPLHEPSFVGNEKKYVRECIDSTFVSSVGKFVEDFETKIKSIRELSMQWLHLVALQLFIFPCYCLILIKILR